MDPGQEEEDGTCLCTVETFSDRLMWSLVRSSAMVRCNRSQLYLRLFPSLKTSKRVSLFSPVGVILGQFLNLHLFVSLGRFSLELLFCFRLQLRKSAAGPSPKFHCHNR